MGHFFAFEADFVESLRCIPMQVRMKLDTCGIKLKLEQWNQFNESERLSLVEMPCQAEIEILEYRHFLQNLVVEKTGSLPKNLPRDEYPAWLQDGEIPREILEKAHSLDITISLEQWKGLAPEQRFALIKLSRPSHENKNFLPALREFKLLS